MTVYSEKRCRTKRRVKCALVHFSMSTTHTRFLLHNNVHLVVSIVLRSGTFERLKLFLRKDAELRVESSNVLIVHFAMSCAHKFLQENNVHATFTHI